MRSNNRSSGLTGKLTTNNAIADKNAISNFRRSRYGPTADNNVTLSGPSEALRSAVADYNVPSCTANAWSPACVVAYVNTGFVGRRSPGSSATYTNLVSINSNCRECFPLALIDVPRGRNEVLARISSWRQSYCVSSPWNREVENGVLNCPTINNRGVRPW